MKTITFETIRNLLRAKKKTTDDCGDTSFKRSDSFKRISIRRSYLNRGRKRAILTAKSNPNVNSHSSNKQRLPSFVNKNVNSGDSVSDRLHKDGTNLPMNEIPIQVIAHDITLHSTINSPEKLNHGDKIESYDNNIHKSRRSIEKYEKNQFEEPKEVTTSTSCFVKASSKLKKPIGTGLDVSAEDTDTILNYADYLNKKQIQHKSSNDFKQFVDNFDLKCIHSGVDSNDSMDRQSRRQNMSKSHMNVTKNENIEIKSTSENQTAINNLNRSIDSIHLSASNSNKKDIWNMDDEYLLGQNRIVYNSVDGPINNITTFDVMKDQKSGIQLDVPSIVVFKTYCNEPNSIQYLETSFDSKEESWPDYNSVCNKQSSSNSRSNENADKMSKNARPTINFVTTSSVTAEAPNHKTITPNKSSIKGSKGVIIQISDSGCNIDYLNRSPLNKNLPIKDSRDSAISENCSDDETSLNGKFTFEIYKQLKTEKNQSLKSTTTTTNCDMKKIDSTRQTVHPTLTEPFQSKSLDGKMNNNFFLETDNYEFNVSNQNWMSSNNNSIPYPLRIKTNPFTNQKEPYSVNLGRVWKHLNLGQDDQSLDASLKTQRPQTNSKLKNDSFRSISSHDSGFSLTLTKQKNLFNRKHKKSRRKSKLAKNSCDNYFKKLKVPSLETMKRNKKKLSKIRISAREGDPSILKTVLTSAHQQHNDNDGTESLKDSIEQCNYDKKADCEQENDTGDSFVQEISDLEAFFEEHLKRLKEYYLQKKKINEQTIDEIYNKCEYSKDQTLNDIQRSVFAKIQQHKNDFENSLKIKKSGARLKTHVFYANEPVRCGEEFGSSRKSIGKSKRHKKKFTNIQLADDLLNCDDTIETSTNDSLDDFQFPFPDKRKGNQNNTKNRQPYQANEIRLRDPHFCNSSRECLEYASLDFSRIVDRNRLIDRQQSTDRSSETRQIGQILIESSHIPNNANQHLRETCCVGEHSIEDQSTLVNYVMNGVEMANNRSDNEYEDIPSDDSDFCYSCENVQTDFNCSEKLDSMNSINSINLKDTQKTNEPQSTILRNVSSAAYSISPDTILCDCIGGLNAQKSNYLKYRKSNKIDSTTISMPKKLKQNKRYAPRISKNHSLRRDFCYISSEY